MDFDNRKIATHVSRKVVSVILLEPTIEYEVKDLVENYEQKDNRKTMFDKESEDDCEDSSTTLHFKIFSQHFSLAIYMINFILTNSTSTESDLIYLIHQMQMN